MRNAPEFRLCSWPWFQRQADVAAVFQKVAEVRIRQRRQQTEPRR
jgi:hypothetical protein